MKAAELKTKTSDQLKELLIGLKKEQFNLRMRAGSGEQLENPARFRQIRQIIARIKTVMNEKKDS